MNHKKVYSSTVEHYSVLKNDLYKLINVDKNGIIKFNELQDNLTAKDCFCCILAHNETGVIQPIQDIKRYLNGAFLHLDCVQVPGKLSLNIEELGADSISISGHKFGAPYGIGCLIYNAEKVKLNPMINGGGQEYGIRSGTEHVIGAYGLGIACEMLENRIEQMSQVIKIRDFIEDQIKQIYPQAIVLKGNRLPNTTSIYMPNASAETQVIYFDAQGYSVSAGSACSSGKIAHPYVFLAMGFEDKIASNIIRVSLGISNSFEEATGFVENWKKLYQHINKSS
jgi:cysteine desulfurase